MLRKNISGLSLWGWLVCVGIFSFNYAVDEVVGTLPTLHYPACPSLALQFTIMPEFRQRLPWGKTEKEAASVLSKWMVEAA